MDSLFGEYQHLLLKQQNQLTFQTQPLQSWKGWQNFKKPDLTKTDFITGSASISKVRQKGFVFYLKG
jgi:hypothetical protein